MIHVMIMILIIRILTISLHCQTSYTNVCFDFREWGYVWKTAFEQLVFAQRDAFYKSMMCSNRTRHILCIYIYIYIYRERERDVWMYMCISHVHVHIYIYIYIYIFVSNKNGSASPSALAASCYCRYYVLIDC